MADLYCPRCAGVVPVTAKFCHRCNLDLQTISPSKVQVDRCRWERTPGEFAVRIPADQLGGLFSKSIDVDQASVGMLFDGGRFKERLEPGTHTVKTLEDRLTTLFSKKAVEVVLIDRGLFPVSIVSSGFQTQSGDDLRFQCDVAVQLGSQIQPFYENVMKQRNRITTADLIAHLRTPVEQSILGIVRTCGIDELLNPHFELRQRFRDQIERELKELADQLGLQLTVPCAPTFFSSSRAGQFQERAEMQKTLRSEKLTQEFERQRIRLERDWSAFERELASEDGQRALQDARNASETREVIETLKAKAGSNDLFRKESAEQEWFEYRKRTEDRDRPRQWMLEDLERRRRTDVMRLEHDFQVEDLENRNELTDIERSRRIRLVDEDLQRDLAQQQTSLDGRLKRERSVFEHDLEIEKQKKQAARSARLADADADVAVDARTFDERHRQGLSEFELEKTKLAHALDIANKERDWVQEQQKNKHSMSEQERDAEHRRQLEAKKSQDEHELNRLQIIGTLSTDALFTVASPQQAAFLLQKVQQDIFKGMTAEQILAMKSGDSAAAGRALEAKFGANQQSQSDQVGAVKEVYDRLIKEIKEGQAGAQQQMLQLVQVIQQVANTALNTQRDVGVAAAGSKQNSSPTDLLGILKGVLQPESHPRQHSNPQQPLAGADDMAACFECKLSVPRSIKFCPQCGKPTAVHS